MPSAEIERALSGMLESIGSQGRQVLAVVDEVSDTVALREFLSAFKAYAERDFRSSCSAQAFMKMSAA